MNYEREPQNARIYPQIELMPFASREAELIPFEEVGPTVQVPEKIKTEVVENVGEVLNFVFVLFEISVSCVGYIVFFCLKTFLKCVRTFVQTLPDRQKDTLPKVVLPTIRQRQATANVINVENNISVSSGSIVNIQNNITL